MIPLGLLFKRFLKLGAVAYGGPAMMAQIKQTVVNKNNWLKEGEFLQGMASASSFLERPWFRW